MVKINPAIKNLLVFLLIICAFALIVFSIPAELTSGQSTLLMMGFILLLFMLAYWLIKRKKKEVKPTSYKEDSDDCVKQLVAQGVMLPVSITDDEVTLHFNYDIAQKLGKKYTYFRFFDPFTRTTRNLLWNHYDKIAIGELKHTKLDSMDKIQACEYVMRLIKMEETGEAPIQNSLETPSQDKKK